VVQETKNRLFLQYGLYSVTMCLHSLDIGYPIASADWVRKSRWAPHSGPWCLCTN